MSRSKFGPKRLLGLQDFKLREIGRWLPKQLEAKREADAEKRANERKPYITAALRELCFTKVRDVIGRKMYKNEPFTLEDWPALKELTGEERTAVFKEARKILDLGDPRPRRDA